MPYTLISLFAALFYGMTSFAQCQPAPDPAVSFDLSARSQEFSGPKPGIVAASKAAVDICKKLSQKEKELCHQAVDAIKTDTTGFDSKAGANEISNTAAQALEKGQNQVQDQFNNKCTPTYTDLLNDCQEAHDKSQQAIQKYQSSLRTPEVCDSGNKLGQAQKNMPQAEDLKSDAKDSYAADKQKVDALLAASQKTSTEMRSTASDTCVDCPADTDPANIQKTGSGPVPIKFIGADGTEQTYYSSSDPASLAANQAYLSSLSRQNSKVNPQSQGVGLQLVVPLK